MDIQTTVGRTANRDFAGADRAQAPARTAAPGLQVRDVAHSFGSVVALDGVTLKVEPGVLTGLLGPNGAGKTTLIRVMLGVLRPSRGQVTYRGRLVDQTLRRHWGYMPQAPPERTGLHLRLDCPWA